jgi:SAM-dependent methyltransferase
MDPSNSLPAPRRGSLGQRWYAWADAHSGSSYETFITGRKQALFGGLHGSVLEIGPGTGPNLRYYGADVRWVGVEPNPFMHPYLQQSIRALGRQAEHFRIEPGDPGGVRLPAGDGSVDAVVGTLVLCSVTNPEESLQEILRVLKPGGRFVFIEHVAAERGSRQRALQNFLQPLWSLVSGNCHPNRETWETIGRAGFARVELEHFRLPSGGPAAPHIAGTAIKGESWL